MASASTIPTRTPRKPPQGLVRTHVHALDQGDVDDVVGIGRDTIPRVEHDERQEHVLDRYLVERAASGDEVRRRVHVCSPLPDVGVAMYEEAVVLDGRDDLAVLVREGDVVRDPSREGMRQVDPAGVLERREGKEQRVVGHG